ncbi:unnamed protein product [Euphydryas editha]|uniref:Gag-pol polyprotein n=1 Tax=Euphydryas editha TaxID=104508 RepID=A0AAU9UKC7_EUPED|nr:unnamed protein product [Euphydryas editha]
MTRFFFNYETKYNQIKKEIKSRMWSSSFKERSIPQMDIPMFYGNYHQWMSFKDLFCETIHSYKSMSNAQKRLFLKGKLRGEAEKLTQHLRISADNYQICWDLLNKRYNNVRLIFNSQINILLSVPTMPHQTAAQIKKLHDTTMECLNAIKAMGIDIANWDPLMVYILSQKLDTQTHQDYIESLSKPRDLPSLSEFLNFSETKFKSLESSKRRQDPERPNYYKKADKKPLQPYTPINKEQNFNNKNYQASYTAKINHSTTKPLFNISQSKCLVCDNYHALFKCKTFLNFTPDVKLKTIVKHKLCKNCLICHVDNECNSSKRCRVCNDAHNSILHEAYVTPIEPSTSLGILNKQHRSEQKSVLVSKIPQEVTPKLLATAKINILASDGRYLTCPRRSLCGGLTYNRKCSTTALFTPYKKELYVIYPNESSWPRLDKIILADPEFYLSHPIDKILSVDVYELIILPGLIRQDASQLQPIAQSGQFRRFSGPSIDSG